MLPGFTMIPKKKTPPPGVDAASQLPGAHAAPAQPAAATGVRPSGQWVQGTVAGGVQKAPTAPTPNAANTVDPNTTGAQASTGGNGPGAGAQQNPGAVYTNPAPPPSIDDLSEQFARQQIQAGLGPVDTSKQEALIRELEQQQVGAGLVGNRASMGRAGFGSSGALAAMQGDTMRQAAQQAAQDILGTRTQAQQQAITNAQAAEGLDIQERNAANQKTELDARLAALQHLLDPTGTASTPTDATAGGDGGVGQSIADTTGISTGTSPLGKDTDQAQLATAGTPNTAASTENPNDPNLPRKSGQQGNDPAVLSTPTYTVYKGADGHLYRVDKG